MQNHNPLDDWKEAHPGSWLLIQIAAGSVVVAAAMVFSLFLIFFSRTPTGTAIGEFLSWLFAGNPPNVTWYITRASGLVAFLLLWLSTLWGLGISTRILGGKLHGSFTVDFHQVTSLLALGFTAIHVLILLLDTFTPFSVAQVLVPFISDYRPGWVGLGVISLYIVALVTVTFYLRDRIGSKTFRAIHTLSLLGFFGAVLHGLFSGTDSSLPVVQVLYFTSASSVIFLFTYWVSANTLQRRQQKLRQAARSIRVAPSRQAGD
jgi:predicted ferric reductase